MQISSDIISIEQCYITNSDAILYIATNENGLKSIINSKLDMVTNGWFKEIELLKVEDKILFLVKQLDDLYNYLTYPEFKPLSKTSFKAVNSFEQGFAVVKGTDNKYNFISTNGEILSPNKWFGYTYDFMKNGFAIVFLDDSSWNFISSKGDIVFPNNKFVDVYGAYFEFAIVLLDDGNMALVNLLKRTIYQKFRYIDAFHNPIWNNKNIAASFATLENNHKLYYRISPNEEPLLSCDMDIISYGSFKNGLGFIKVKNSQNKYNIIDINGNLLLKGWYNNIYLYNKDEAIGDYIGYIFNGGKKYYIRKDGKMTKRLM